MSSLLPLRGSWGRRWRQVHCHWCPKHWWWRQWNPSDLRHPRLWPRQQNATRRALHGPMSAGRRSCLWPHQLWIHSQHPVHGGSTAGPPGQHPYLGQTLLPTTSKVQQDREGDDSIMSFFLLYLIIEMQLTWRDILTGSTSQQLCVVMNSLVGKSGIIPQLLPPPLLPLLLSLLILTLILNASAAITPRAGQRCFNSEP